MADNDYICVYRQFFEEFAKTFQTEDCRPMRVNIYNLSLDELAGEVMYSCVNFFNERKCPRSLVLPMTKIVVEEFLKEAKKQPEEVDTPLKLNRKTFDKILEVCMRYTDNEKLSSLPAPVDETFYTTHSTKHIRRRMEDRLICLPRFNSLHGIQSNSEAEYYAIFDGHSGVSAACYAVSHLHQFLAESLYYPDDPVQAFREAFKKTDDKYNAKDENSGTAVLAILYQPVEKRLTVSWVGDSQAMVVSEDSYVMLVDPHKPEREDERRRIEALGGFISKLQSVYRVNGGLAISRAIGDQKLKPFVNAEPELRVVNLKGSEHFIVMGCDGLWDVIDPQQVIETVYFEVKKNKGQIETVAKRLVDLAKENNSTDNISVIVIFLTNPSEISNRSVDVTGHRPKILLQNGEMMEANIQSTEKSPLSDSGVNGIYERNGNHLDDHMKNDSDEDFGPETDVDALDEVVTSPKNFHPFANECWQKSQLVDEKLIKYGMPESDSAGDEMMKFSENFLENKEKNESISGGVQLDNFSQDNTNPFGAPVQNAVSEFGDLAKIEERNDKYLEEVDSKKDELDNFMKSDFDDEALEMQKNQVNLEEKFSNLSTANNPFGVDSNFVTEPNQNFTDFNQTSPDFIVDPVNLPHSEEEKTDAVVEDLTKETLPQNVEPIVKEEIALDVSRSPEPASMNTTQKDEINDLTFDLSEPKVNEIGKNSPLDADENVPKICSLNWDFVDIENELKNKEKLSMPELLSPSAPVLDGEASNEVVAESGGEIEDSEDEWNYVKVEQKDSGASVNNDLVSPLNESSEIEKSTMNSPLNPNAAEFIPVAPITVEDEFGLNETPKKAVPQDLSDIVAASPNWMDMKNVSVPEESAFLDEIRSRPSNIFESFENINKQESCVEELKTGENVELNVENKIPELEEKIEKPNELNANEVGEVHGLALASDMTSSFIDPSTMSVDNEVPIEQSDVVASPVEPLVEKQSSVESAFEAQKFENLTSDVTSKFSDLLSPASNQEDVSSISPIPETPKSTGVEVPLTPNSEPVTSELSQPFIHEVQETKSTDPSPVTQTPPPTPFDKAEPQTLAWSETSGKSPIEEKPKDDITSGGQETPLGAPVVETVAATTAVAVAATAAAAVTAAATAPTDVAAVKKEVKKAASKSVPSNATKAPTTGKPLLNGTKTSTTTKKPMTTTQPAKTPVAAKTTLSTAAPRISSKTTSKGTTPISNTSSAPKASPRPKPTVTSSLSKTSTPTKTTVTNTTTTKSPTASTNKPIAKPGPTSTVAAPKPKPRVPSAPIEKKPTMNGEVKSTIRRTEVTAKKPTTTTITSTRVSLSARPATAPAKSTTPKTTTTITRTLTAKPKATLSSTTVTTTTVTSTSVSATKASPAARKTTLSSDKQAKEIANRITSKTSSVTKTNGVVKGKTTATLTKTRKTATTPSKTKDDNKTEIKAEKIVESVEIIQSENANPLIENNKDINLINSIASE